MQQTTDDLINDLYKLQKRTMNKQIRNEKVAYYNTMIVQSSSKSKTLNKRKGRSQPKQQMTIKYINQISTNAEDIADIPHFDISRI